MAETPKVLLPYQQRVLNDNARIRLVEKSRRIGLSWAIACEMALDASEVNGCDGWYIGYNKEMTEEFIRDVESWAKKYSIAASTIEESQIFEGGDESKAILTYKIRFASGWRVTALSSAPKNLRNKKGHICIDEAAHHEDLEAILQAAIPAKIWGGQNRIDIISTHYGEDNFFNTLIKDTRAGRKSYSLHRTTIHDALEEGFYKRICLVNGWEWSQKAQKEWLDELFSESINPAEEYECTPSRSGGVYIPRDLIERAMRLEGDVVRLELEDEFLHWQESARVGHVEQWCAKELLPLLKKLPTDKLHFFGEDFGRVSDRTVIAVGHLTTKLKRRFPLVVEMGNVPFEQQRQVLFYIVDRLPRFFHGVLDSNGNGSYLAEVALQRYGERHITAAKLTEPWYHENLPPFKACFEDDNIEMLIDLDHLLDIQAFLVLQGQPKLPKTKTKSTRGGKDRHGDAGIAYLCGHIASRQPVMRYEYTTPNEAQRKNSRFKKSTAARLRVKKGGIL
jgi:phage FluMu gp28-like protein